MPHVFISYAKVDTRLLAEKLFELINKMPEFTAWMDKSLEPAESWASQIQEHINRADIVIVLLSPDVNRPVSAQQRRSFVLNEIDYSQEAHKKILPIMVQKTRMPVQIAGVQYIDFTEDEDAGVKRLEHSLERLKAGTSIQDSMQVSSNATLMAHDGYMGFFVNNTWNKLTLELKVAIVVALISGVFAILAGATQGFLGFWEVILAPTPTTEVALVLTTPFASETATLTDMPTLTETSSPSPTETIRPSDTPINPNDLVALTRASNATATATHRTPTATDTLASNTPTPIPVNNAYISSIGNANVYASYDTQLEYPSSMLIELQLILFEAFITPTPIGEVTVVSVNQDIATPIVSALEENLTPHPARISDEISYVPPFLIAELQCSNNAFSGCQEDAVRELELRGINTWSWNIQAISEDASNQNLTLLLYKANADGTKISNTPLWLHHFTVAINSPFSLRKVIEDNFGALITGFCGILGILLPSGFAVWKFILQKDSPAQAVSIATNPKQLTGTRIFISYRRKVGWSIARKIYDDLTSRGASVFLDVEDIHEGKFKEYITKNIGSCDYFVLVLVSTTLESEWVIKEIQYAHKFKKTIIPMLVDGFDLYSGSVPDEVKYIQAENAITIIPEFYEAAIEKLVSFVQPKV